VSNWHCVSRRWCVGFGLVLAQCVAVTGAVAADVDTVIGRCGEIVASASAGAGHCGGKGKGGQTTTPAAGSATNVNVAVACGAACGAAERAASGASGTDVAAPPAWATAHLAAEDALRKQDRDLRDRMLLVGGAVAAVLAIAAAWLAVLAVSKGELRFTSHWGGFGGSTGGWEITPGVVSLLAALMLAAMAAAIIGCVLEAVRTPAPTAPPVPRKAAEAGDNK